MAGEPRLTTELVEQAEEFEDAFDRALRDGALTAAEAADPRRRARAMVTAAASLDAGIALVITALRRGIDAPRFRRQLREHDRDLRVVVRNDDRGGSTAA